MTYMTLYQRSTNKVQQGVSQKISHFVLGKISTKPHGQMLYLIISISSQLAKIVLNCVSAITPILAQAGLETITSYEVMVPNIETSYNSAVLHLKGRHSQCIKKDHVKGLACVH